MARAFPTDRPQTQPRSRIQAVNQVWSKARLILQPHGNVAAAISTPRRNGINLTSAAKFTVANIELGGRLPANAACITTSSDLVTTWPRAAVLWRTRSVASVQSVRPTRTLRRSDRSDRPSGVNTEEIRTSTVIVGPPQGCTTVEPQRLPHHLAQQQIRAGSLAQPTHGVVAPRPKGLS